MIRTLFLAPALLLAGCGAEPAAQTNMAAAAQPEVDYLGRIRAMPQGQRNAVFLRAIRDAGRACQEVTALSEVTAPGGPATWSATCEDGAQWIVAISPSGTATVTNQAELQGAAKG